MLASVWTTCCLPRQALDRQRFVGHARRMCRAVPKRCGNGSRRPFRRSADQSGVRRSCSAGRGGPPRSCRATRRSCGRLRGNARSDSRTGCTHARACRMASPATARRRFSGRCITDASRRLFDDTPLRRTPGTGCIELSRAARAPALLHRKCWQACGYPAHHPAKPLMRWTLARVMQTAHAIRPRRPSQHRLRKCGVPAVASFPPRGHRAPRAVTYPRIVLASLWISCASVR